MGGNNGLALEFTGKEEGIGNNGAGGGGLDKYGYKLGADDLYVGKFCGGGYW